MRFSGRALAVAACLAAPLACHAVDGTITITGTVTSETCTINGGGSGSSSFTVALPKVSTATLASVGATAGRTQFTIALTGCTNVVAGNVFPYFEPGTTINAAGRLINSGTATNLDVELLNNSFAAVNLAVNSGSQNTTPVSLTGTSATLTYYAQYRATGSVGAGSVNTNVTYTIIYP